MTQTLQDLKDVISTLTGVVTDFVGDVEKLLIHLQNAEDPGPLIEKLKASIESIKAADAAVETALAPAGGAGGEGTATEGEAQAPGAESDAADTAPTEG